MYGFNYYGIRLLTERKKTVLEISFWDFKYAEWTSLQEIPADQNIIGLKCNTESQFIFHLSFLLSKIGDTQPIGELNFPETVKAYSNSTEF